MRKILKVNDSCIHSILLHVISEIRALRHTEEIEVIQTNVKIVIFLEKQYRQLYG